MNITDMAAHEIVPGVFKYRNEVYKIDADGTVSIWVSDTANMGGFFGGIFKSIGKVFKKVAKVAVKVAPYAAIAYGGYSLATAISSGSAFSSVAGAAKAAGNVVSVAGGVPGGSQTPIVAETPPPNILETVSTAAIKILPVATEAVSAYYNNKTAQAAGQAQLPPDAMFYSNMTREGQIQSVVMGKSVAQSPSTIPDVTPSLADYKVPLIGGGLVLMVLLGAKRARR
jgi:hypothetical protein